MIKLINRLALCVVATASLAIPVQADQIVTTYPGGAEGYLMDNGAVIENAPTVQPVMLYGRAYRFGHHVHYHPANEPTPRGFEINLGMGGAHFIY